MGMFDAQGGPEFSLAGMILGGRGYAANWFQQRDQMLWAQAAEAKQNAAEKAAGLAQLEDPRYQAFRDRPYDRAASLDYVMGSRGLPGQIDEHIASYVGQSLGAQYNKAQSELSAQEQRENTAYAHTLNLDEIKARGQNELDVYNQKAAIDQERQNKMIGALMQTPTEMNTNMAVRLKLGNDAFPQDRSVKFGPDGGMYTVPMTGSADHIKMMTQLNAGETIVDTLTDMSTSLERGDYTVDGWNSQVTNLAMTVKSLYSAGSLDQGLLDQVNQMIPKVSRIPDPNAKARALEQLRATIMMTRKNNEAVASSYSVPLTDLPAGKGDAKYFPVPRGEPPATGSVTAAQKQIQNQPPVPAPSYGQPYDSSSPGSVFQ